MDYTKAEEWQWGRDSLEGYYTMCGERGMRRWWHDTLVWAECPNAEDVIREAAKSGEWRGCDLSLDLIVCVKDDAVGRLIEAAPVLLRACREVLAALSKRPGTDDGLVRILEDAIDLAEVRQ